MPADPVAQVDDAIAHLRTTIASAIASAAMPTGDAPLLGDLIKSRRKQLGLSLDAVGASAGCTKSHIWEMEQNRSANPTVMMVDGLARALQLPFVMVAHSALATAKEHSDAR